MAQQSIESNDAANVKHETDAEMSDDEADHGMEVDLDVAEDTDQWL